MEEEKEEGVIVGNQEGAGPEKVASDMMRFNWRAGDQPEGR